MSPAIGNMQAGHEPMDRLTRICAAMTDTFDDHDEHHDGDRCIVFLDDGDTGGIEIHGYDNAVDAFVDLILHVKAMLQSVSQNLDIVFVNDEGEVVHR